MLTVGVWLESYRLSVYLQVQSSESPCFSAANRLSNHIIYMSVLYQKMTTTTITVIYDDEKMMVTILVMMIMTRP